MKQYDITGMSCAACSSRVEKAVLKVPGVTSCSVNLLTNSMGVDGSASSENIISAVQRAGYGATLKMRHTNTAPVQSVDADERIDHEIKALKHRLIASLIFLAVLMVISMGHTMWGWPLPAFLSNNPIAIGILQMLLTIAVMVINQRFFKSGFQSLWHRAPNMDTLVALGAAAAFIYSTFALFAMTDARIHGNMSAMMDYMHEFYFESAAMILTLITVGKMLEARSKGKTTDALKGLMKLAPKTATILQDGVETVVAIDRVKKGDHFVVRPGESIPVDGIILDGVSAINESALTGESIPVDKAPGDLVSAATLNQSGFIRCEATRVGEDTTLSQIIQMVSDATATKAPIAKVADQVSGVFVPIVIAISVVAMISWLIAGQSVGFALARGISVLVISCPCALGLATPVAIMVGNGVGAKNGILFKNAQSIEQTGKIRIVALDKTGTVTEGQPRVTEIIPAPGNTREELLQLAYTLEQKSEHPLARAILQKAEEERLHAEEVSDFLVQPGNGLTAVLNGNILRGGKLEFIKEHAGISDEMIAEFKRLASEGKTPLFFSKDDKLIGITAVADTIKEDSPHAVRVLQSMGLHVVMLTGDNQRTARAIARQVGVDEVIAEVLPSGKESVIRTLQERGKVAMVGDGINDAPALTRADIGIAIGAGTDVAIDAADVVLMKNRLSDVPAAIHLSRATLRNIHENLFWAFIYNVIGIPLAAGVLIPLFGLQLNPMFGAAAMSLSSFCVVMNALRLNFVEIYDFGKDKSIKVQQKKEKEMDHMKKILKIEGMMCGHCEARVKKALEALPEVAEATVQYQSGSAVVTLNASIADDVLKAAIEAEDYTVVSIE